MTQRDPSLIIREADIRRMVELDLLRKIYVAYTGFGSSADDRDEASDSRRDIILAETILVLKGFFVPATAFKNKPDKQETIDIMQSALVNVNFKDDYRLIAAKARHEAVKMEPYLREYADPKDQPSMGFSGNSRKFDILTRHFGFGDQRIRKCLHQVCLSNTF